LQGNASRAVPPPRRRSASSSPARTITPRLAARAGVPLIRVLAGTVPAALVWVTGLVTGGALLTAAADTISPHWQ